MVVGVRSCTTSVSRLMSYVAAPPPEKDSTRSGTVLVDTVLQTTGSVAPSTVRLAAILTLTTLPPMRVAPEMFTTTPSSPA